MRNNVLETSLRPGGSSKNFTPNLNIEAYIAACSRFERMDKYLISA